MNGCCFPVIPVSNPLLAVNLSHYGSAAKRRGSWKAWRFLHNGWMN